MKTKCTNQECLYEWDYKGRSNFFACCPRCHKQIRISEKKK